MMLRMSTRSEEGFGGAYRLDDFPLLSPSPYSSSFLSSLLSRHSRFLSWGSAQHQQIIGDDSQSHPAFHAGHAAIEAAVECVTSLQGVAAPFRSRAPAQSPPNPALLLISAPPRRQPAVGRKGHASYPGLPRPWFVDGRTETGVRGGQSRRTAQQLPMPLQRRLPQFSIGHALGTDLVIGDELRLGLLD